MLIVLVLLLFLVSGSAYTVGLIAGYRQGRRAGYHQGRKFERSIWKDPDGLG